MTSASSPRRRAYGQRRFKPLPELEARTLEAGLVLSDAALARRLHEAAALHLEHLGREKLDPRPINSATGLYNNVFRKTAKASGQSHGRLQMIDAVKACYPGVVTPADAATKVTSVRCFLGYLVAAGVIRYWPELGPDGEMRGLRWELCQVRPRPEEWPGLYYSARRYAARAGARSSVDVAAGGRRRRARLVCKLRPRRRAPRDPRRMAHPYNRRIGHGSTSRHVVAWEPAPPSSFAVPTFWEASSCPSPFGRRATDSTARERRAHAPDLPPSAVAALEPTTTASSEQGGAERVVGSVRGRWFGLTPARHAVAREGFSGLLELWEAGGASDCAIAAAAFESVFPAYPGDERDRPGYACLSAAGAGRLERAIRRGDRLAGGRVTLLVLLEDIASWQPTWDGLLKRIDGLTRRFGGIADGALQTVAVASGGPRVVRPASLGFFAQRIHRYTKLEATRRRGGLNYQQRAELERRVRDFDRGQLRDEEAQRARGSLRSFLED